MKRRNKNNTQDFEADFILTADWHLRETKPDCRTDNFEEAQWKKVDFVVKLALNHNCAVIIAGDVYHHWKPSPELLAKTMIHLRPLDGRVYVVYGQHDLPEHSFQLREKSGIYTLEQAGVVKVLQGTHYGHAPTLSLMSKETKGKQILVWHRFVWDGVNLPWAGCDLDTAKDILLSYHYDLIVTGDHHRPFYVTEGNRMLVNPGCLTRQATDFADYQPYVFLYNAEKGAVSGVPVPCAKGVVSTERIKFRDRRDRRIEAFISRLTEEYEVSVDFEENLRRFFKENMVKGAVKELVYRAIDQES